MSSSDTPLRPGTGRRTFVAGLAAGTLSIPFAARARRRRDRDELFTHGVASGDPLADGVILWTRIAPRRLRLLPVQFEVARDPGFRSVVRRGVAFARAEADWTVKVDVRGLPPGTPLHYRFHALGRTSPTGRTRTLPVGAVRQVRFAVFSCSNYPAGFFHAYAEAARTDELDAAIHLGDYLYEYPRGGYASEDAQALERLSEPAGELLTLDDYRTRYAQYRDDEDLQDLHAAVPFICVWDDHELANDAWRDGAENHDPATEGSFAARRAAAIRAYHEWMPIRVENEARPDAIWRSFAWGDLVELHMLDTRLAGRDRQLALASFVGAGGVPDLAAFEAALAAPSRQLLGAEQTDWLLQRFATGKARWTVLGQQVLMARMRLPLPLLANPTATFPGYATILAKLAAGVPLSPAEQALLSPTIPYNLDAWDGYDAARETVLAAARARNRNLVVLAGDTHNAWASLLRTRSGEPVGVEFATPGVSSPGLEAVFPQFPPAQIAAAFTALIEPLVWAETARRGFMIVTATPTECRAEWRFVSTVKSQDYTVTAGPAFRTLPGAPQVAAG